MALARGAALDNYRIVELIGAGAMGEVYLAHDETLGRKVAIKILAETHRDSPEVRARFVREARVVAAIAHPNVVQVFTTGEHQRRPYLAMEYLSGRDLGTVVREDGPLEPLEAAAAIRDAARGLSAAARAGLIHRDVKPSNLMLLDDGTVKVTDFGLAKPVEAGSEAALTAFGVVVGTPDYIAPEQARGDDIDWRVDVYALGCTLFFLLTGRPPFRNNEEEKYLKVVARHLREAAPDPRDYRSDAKVDDGLATLQLEMMAKSRDERPDYSTLIARLDQVQARLLGGDLRARPRSGGLSTAAPAVARRGPPRWLVALSAASALTFLLGLGLFLLGQRATPAAAGQRSVELRPQATDAGPQLQPADPKPPSGMLRVHGPQGERGFFVARTPVTHRAFAEFARSHRYPRKDADRPVTNVSFDYALAYARFRGQRLVRASEWQLALATPGFVPAGMRLWEWVNDGVDAAQIRAVRRVNGGVARRNSAGSSTVTFRLAQDLSK